MDGIEKFHSSPIPLCERGQKKTIQFNSSDVVTIYYIPNNNSTILGTRVA